MSYVSTGVRKKDVMSLVTGKGVYTGDTVPAGALRLKLLRSPHVHAFIRPIDVSRAKQVPGVVCVLTYEDAPGSRFTTAGQTYPEPSPYDRLILDRLLRCTGDPVAIVAAETEEAVERACRLIRVDYEVRRPLLDFTQALDNEIIVHPEENFRALCDVGTDARRNLVSTEGFEVGNVEQALAQSAVVLERTYDTKSNSQAMMEPFCTYTYFDKYGRLTVVSSTQVPFHVRRILSNALEMPKGEIRVIKPRIGGGFGAKQSAASELFPALVTKKTGRAAYLCYTRRETFTNGSPRHQMQMRVRIGADRDGTINATDLHALSNAGAYGGHGPTTIGLVGHKSLSFYGKLMASRFQCEVVYTNTMGAGAYRGYGAAQGIFAVESAVNELAAGAASARPGAYLCFFVCDQPYMTEAHLRSFWEEFYKSGKTMGRMRAGARFGSPTVFAPQFRPALMALMGDEGGRTLFAGHEGEIHCYDAAPEVLRDFDYPWAQSGDP